MSCVWDDGVSAVNKQKDLATQAMVIYLVQNLREPDNVLIVIEGVLTYALGD